MLVLTVHGPFALQRWLKSLPQDDPRTQELARTATESVGRRGTYFHVDDVWAADFPSYYQSMFHAPWYVFEHWTNYFDILSYVPRGSLAHQDMVLLHHRQSA